MLSAEEIASMLLTGWKTSGTSLDIILKLSDVEMDTVGVVTGFNRSKLTLGLSGSRVIELPLEGLSLSAAKPLSRLPVEPAKSSDCIAAVTIMRDSDPICVLFEMPKFKNNLI